MVGTNVARIRNKKMQSNNTSGHTGVSYHVRRGQWYARISFRGKTYSLGYYDNLDDAIAARKKAEKIKFDDFLKQYRKTKVIEV